jgi:hypothetical protein
MIAIRYFFTLFPALVLSIVGFSQVQTVKGVITSSGKPVESATVTLNPGRNLLYQMHQAHFNG